ncbi:probable ATP-dependent helicase PF08_0048 isoform X2 [Acyrthosiphon pisum]|uniref:Uncharacterized protein n=1 Tax=Acyrthosiphon pisum TaxID=7029 RepID=A0A8R2H4J0_ACYPI|nr:probable ATP-dependent helicase PF08_0048 isoform X2 [Acyrthosiphon pisum]|eukprot:XP_016658101.1 PREDICTED: probable ATP-dependent helicase PF08_0048 isoform X2 [Acyrthosiphon pisum]
MTKWKRIPKSALLKNFLRMFQGYHLSTISQVLTPSERITYILFGTLPSRIYYSYKKRCYVVRGQAGYYKNDLRRKKGKKYKVVPRWQYYLSKLSPMSLIKSGFECLSIGKALLFGGGFSDGDEEEDLESGGADPDAGGGADGDADGGADDGADGDADDANDNDKEPGLLSKGMNMGKSMLSPLLNLFGGSKNTNNDNNNENKDDSNDKKDENKDDSNDKKDDNNDNKDENKDDKEGDKPADSTNYMGIAKDILTSDTTKDALKTGISLLVPGGPAIVKAIDTAEKYQSADEKIDKVQDKIPKLK